MKNVKPLVLLSMLGLLASCATVETAVQAPVVTLKQVDIAAVSFKEQTFVLNFDVRNPNLFALPVNHISYGVMLDQHRFASGEAVTSFTIPANGESEFAISVELDLLSTAPQLLYTVRDAEDHELPYELSGQLGVDIPFIDRVPFQKQGEIRLQPRLVTRATKASGDESP